VLRHCPHSRLRHAPAHFLRSRISVEKGAHLTQHGHGVGGLLVDPPGGQPPPERIQFGRVDLDPEQLRPGPVGIEERRPGGRENPARDGRDDSLVVCGLQCPADVHRRLGQGPVPLPGGRVPDRYLVVPVQGSVPEGLVDPADAAHPEAVELGRAQRPQAGAAEHVDAMFHHPHDFLVPHGGHTVEVAVDDADGTRAAPPQPVDVPGGHRGEVDGVEFGPRVLLGQRAQQGDVPGLMASHALGVMRRDDRGLAPFCTARGNSAA